MNKACLQTITEMLQDRGHTQIETDEDEMNAYNPLTGKRILVYYISDPKVSVKNIKSIKSNLDRIDVDTLSCLIVVYKYSITTFAKQFISSDVNNLFVQVFSEKELMFNITKHEYVPKHIVLTTEEKCSILKKYNTKSRHFPQILQSDPICRYYGMIPGDMVRIERPSETCGMYTVYRIVV